ncbi:phosphotransferase [Paenibacillus sp. CF384]|uniref:phosphotransferase n=1 Tax=Paenibacillus sp. CF384 TaxID=1884382 RepID=UPI00089C7B1C|nr:phosphotransferase [Paenibacillus sp. CF384]SDX78263.1 homoserine kinase type II [Paenibacillus sp. CF384]
MGQINEGELAEYLHAYRLDPSRKIVQEESGMNNTTRMVYSGSEKFVLRIYENHRDEALIRTEHAILDELQRQKLSFEVPLPVLNRSSCTITKGSSGKLAALYHFINGNRPTPELDSHLLGLGNAAGELSQALALVNVNGEIVPQYKPYYELDENHGSMSEEVLIGLCERSERLLNSREKLASLQLEREQLMVLRDKIASLPQQWIHGDIVFTNAVAAGVRVTGLLDFEFCTIDVRVMELAVALAEFPSEDHEEAIRRIALFCSGYGRAAKLTEEEVLMLPALVKLRMIDVWLHFAGRLYEGMDSDEIWLDQVERAAFVCDWIDRWHEELMKVFRRHLS